MIRREVKWFAQGCSTSSALGKAPMATPGIHPRRFSILSWLANEWQQFIILNTTLRCSFFCLLRATTWQDLTVTSFSLPLHFHLYFLQGKEELEKVWIWLCGRLGCLCMGSPNPWRIRNPAAYSWSRDRPGFAVYRETCFSILSSPMLKLRTTWHYAELCVLRKQRGRPGEGKIRYGTGVSVVRTVFSPFSNATGNQQQKELEIIRSEPVQFQ